MNLWQTRSHLENAELNMESKFPIYLPNHNHITELIKEAWLANDGEPNHSDYRYKFTRIPCQGSLKFGFLNLKLKQIGLNYLGPLSIKIDNG
ncbi:unnamed protein product [Dracunculus medinensis]|uniref:Transposase n=1 Tax=Dracunculus medinensis TaxID=318479 RepID=A0A0N4UI66_DRAME|nr:unnamed protein product [Dracunculus medinensis]VDN60898.1 unnamed protein product [Dracunculus medinensis]